MGNGNLDMMARYSQDKGEIIRKKLQHSEDGREKGVTLIADKVSLLLKGSECVCAHRAATSTQTTC